MIFKYLIQKEFIQIKRNAFLPKLIIVFPIMIMCVMPWVMNMEVKNIRVVVVDNDRTSESQQFVHRIEASGYFMFQGQAADYAGALKEVETGVADVIVDIPRGFTRSRTSGEGGRVMIAANATNGTKGSMGVAYITRIYADQFMKTLANSEMVSSLFLFNKGLNYKVFMIPALMALVIMLMCGFLPTLNIVGEKEAGTIEQINVTPVSKMGFIMAKLVPYWIIALFIITVCMLISWALYGITCQGNMLLVYLLSMLLALFFSSFGLIISNYSDTLQQAVMVMWFFVVILMLMSGLFTPVRSMPEWAYATTYVNPMHYFIDAIRTVFVRGGTFESIATHVFALGGIASLMACWAVLSYKKNH